jgi:hypothetical protein
LCKLVMYQPLQESSRTDTYIMVGTNHVFMLSFCCMPLYKKQPCEDVDQANQNETYV